MPDAETAPDVVTVDEHITVSHGLAVMFGLNGGVVLADAAPGPAVCPVAPVPRPVHYVERPAKLNPQRRW